MSVELNVMFSEVVIFVILLFRVVFVCVRVVLILWIVLMKLIEGIV